MLNFIQSKNDLIDFSEFKLGTVSFEINISGSSSVSNTFLDKFFSGFKNWSDPPMHVMAQPMNPQSSQLHADFEAIILKLSLDILRCNFKSSMISSNWNFDGSFQVFIR